MKTEIIDGKKISLEIKEKIKETIYINRLKRRPKLVIFYIGYNVSSEIYIKYKKKFAEDCGMVCEIIHYDENISFSIVKNKINQMNNDKYVDGIMIQLPIEIFSKKDVNSLLEAINPDKDVDGLTSSTLGKTWISKELFLASSTALAVMEIIKRCNLNINGKNIVIIGNTIVLGKPLAGMLSNEHATISILNSSTENISFYTLNADVIISATGKKELLKNNMIKKGVVLIDVGTNKDENNKTHGDFNVLDMLNKASIISPSPGGVGPITIAMLIKNTLKAYLKHEEEN